MHLDRHSAKNELPYPLAVLYDRIRHHDPKARLDAVLALLEGICRYVAIVLLADAAASGASRGTLKKYAEASGFGSYLNVIEHFVGARSSTEGRIFRELDAIVAGRTWALLSVFNELRNDNAHWRMSPTSDAAQCVLAEQVTAIQTVLDDFGFLRRYPLGMIQGTRTLPGPRTQGQWYAARGLSLRSGFAQLEDIAALPSDQLIVVDPDRRRALTVAPFLVVVDGALLWHDPVKGKSPRKPYAAPVPGTPLSPAVPEGLYDPNGGKPAGFTIEEWLMAPSTWCLYTAFPPSGGALEKIMEHSRATQVFESAYAPAAAQFASDPAKDPTWASIPPIEPVVTPSQPSPSTVWAPTPPPVWSPAAQIAPTLVSSPAPPPSPIVAPHDSWSPSSLAPSVSSPAPRKDQRSRSRVAAGVAFCAIGIFAVGLSLALRRTNTDSLPAQAEFAELRTWSELETKLRAWNQAVESQSESGEGEDLHAFYADSLLVRGYRTVEGIRGFYVQFFRRNESSRTVDWSNSQWRVEALEPNTPGYEPCAAVPGAADGVLLVRLRVNEDDPSRPGRGSHIPCARLHGVYTLRMRAIPGQGLRICHEEWPVATLCAGGVCPRSTVCDAGIQTH